MLCKTVLLAIALTSFGSTHAYSVEMPMTVALDAAMASLASCEKSGYHVTVTVVDKAGLPIVVLKGDRAPPHTLDTARAKAYTAMTLGPLFGEDRTSRIAAKVRSKVASQPLEQVQGVLLLGGGASISIDGEIVAGIGVGGAPGGLLDEACASVGANRVKNRSR